MTVSPQAINIKFGSELRKRREQAGLTQRQLAHAVHLSQGQISALERGAKGQVRIMYSESTSC
jgi:transcriptional regulator with XRE-family HTH domain